MTDQALRRAAQPWYVIPRQYWQFDIAINYAHIYARLSGKRFTVRRFGSTNNGKPVWEIAPK